ncbi:MAG TPA: DUF6152 family protein [Candidatus Acidoferrales bacterium]
MKIRPLAAFVLAMGILSVSGRALAHHSWTSYDLTKLTTVHGTVSRFNWSNPHISIDIDVRDERGELRKWVAGGPSPSRMNRGGWDRNTVKPGDQITAIGNPAKDGSAMMRLGKAILANGQELVVYGNR